MKNKIRNDLSTLKSLQRFNSISLLTFRSYRALTVSLLTPCNYIPILNSLCWKVLWRIVWFTAMSALPSQLSFYLTKGLIYSKLPSLNNFVFFIACHLLFLSIHIPITARPFFLLPCRTRELLSHICLSLFCSLLPSCSMLQLQFDPVTIR